MGDEEIVGADPSDGLDEEVTEEDIVGFLERQMDFTLDVDASAVYGAGVCCLPFPRGYARRRKALRVAASHCRMLYVALLTGGEGEDVHIDELAECLHALYSCADIHGGGNGDGNSSTRGEAGAELVVGLPVPGLADIGNVALRREVQLLLGVSGAGIDKWANAIGALNLMRASVGAGKLKFLECGEEADAAAAETESDTAAPPQPLQAFPASTFFDCVGVLLPPPSPSAPLGDHKLALSVAAALLSSPAAAAMPHVRGPPASDTPAPRKLMLLFADTRSGEPSSKAVALAGAGLARRFVAAVAAGKLVDDSDDALQSGGGGVGALIGAVEVAAVHDYATFFGAAQCVVLLESCASHSARVDEEKRTRSTEQVTDTDTVGGGGAGRRSRPCDPDAHPSGDSGAQLLTYTVRTTIRAPTPSP